MNQEKSQRDGERTALAASFASQIVQEPSDVILSAGAGTQEAVMRSPVAKKTPGAVGGPYAGGGVTSPPRHGVPKWVPPADLSATPPAAATKKLDLDEETKGSTGDGSKRGAVRTTMALAASFAGHLIQEPTDIALSSGTGSHEAVMISPVTTKMPRAVDVSYAGSGATSPRRHSGLALAPPVQGDYAAKSAASPTKKKLDPDEEMRQAKIRAMGGGRASMANEASVGKLVHEPSFKVLAAGPDGDATVISSPVMNKKPGVSYGGSAAASPPTQGGLTLAPSVSEDYAAKPAAPPGKLKDDTDQDITQAKQRPMGGLTLAPAVEDDSATKPGVLPMNKSDDADREMMQAKIRAMGGTRATAVNETGKMKRHSVDLNLAPPLPVGDQNMLSSSSAKANNAGERTSEADREMMQAKMRAMVGARPTASNDVISSKQRSSDPVPFPMSTPGKAFNDALTNQGQTSHSGVDAMSAALGRADKNKSVQDDALARKLRMFDATSPGLESSHDAPSAHARERRTSEASHADTIFSTQEEALARKLRMFDATSPGGKREKRSSEAEFSQADTILSTQEDALARKLRMFDATSPGLESSHDAPSAHARERRTSEASHADTIFSTQEEALARKLRMFDGTSPGVKREKRSSEAEFSQADTILSTQEDALARKLRMFDATNPGGKLETREAKVSDSLDNASVRLRERAIEEKMRLAMEGPSGTNNQELFNENSVAGGARDQVGMGETGHDTLHSPQLSSQENIVAEKLRILHGGSLPPETTRTSSSGQAGDGLSLAPSTDGTRQSRASRHNRSDDTTREKLNLAYAPGVGQVNSDQPPTLAMAPSQATSSNLRRERNASLDKNALVIDSRAAPQELDEFHNHNDDHEAMLEAALASGQQFVTTARSTSGSSDDWAPPAREFRAPPDGYNVNAAAKGRSEDLGDVVAPGAFSVGQRAMGSRPAFAAGSNALTNSQLSASTPMSNSHHRSAPIVVRPTNPGDAEYTVVDTDVMSNPRAAEIAHSAIPPEMRMVHRNSRLSGIRLFFRSSTDNEEGGNEQKDEGPGCIGRNLVWIILGTIILVIGLGAGLAFGLGGGGGDEENQIPITAETSSPTGHTPPTTAPTGAPTMTPTSGIDISLFQSYVADITSDASVFEDASSAQYRALVWMSQNPENFLLSQESIKTLYVLTVFYYSTNGPEYLSNPTWDQRVGFLESNDACTWNGEDKDNGSPIGVYCDGSQNVQSLIFASNNLVGTIPDEIGALSSLQNLLVGYNELTSSLPANLFALSALAIADFSSNALSGTVPDSLSTATTLQTLHLGYNRFEGSIPLAQFSESATCGLEFLVLAENLLTGTFPLEGIAANCSNLNTLNLGSSGLTGGTIPSIGLEALTTLNLRHMRLTGTIPETISRLSLLQDLEVDLNYLSGTIPTSIGELTNLLTLSLSDNRLDGPVPPTIGNVTSLKILDIRSNLLSGVLPTDLSSCTNLVQAQFEFNFLSGDMELFCCPMDPELTILTASCISEIACSCCTECF